MRTNMLIKVLVGVLTAGTVMAQYPSVSSNPIVLDTRHKGFELSICAYSFRRYTALEAIEKTKNAGVSNIEFFLWQKFSLEFPDVKLDQNLADQHIKTLQTKLQECGVRPINAYVSSANLGKTEEEMRKLFVFAQKLGIPQLTGEPAPSQLDMLEKLVKEYNILFCFHNHAKNPDKPNYRNWDPDYLMGLLKDRDPRMGFSVDTGHIYRSNMDPVAYLKTVEGRINSIHLKDVKELKSGSPDTVFGKGAGDIAAVLTELKRQGFSGQIGIEFDHLGNQLDADIKTCLEFIQAHK